jgi:hypothetical protein
MVVAWFDFRIVLRQDEDNFHAVLAEEINIEHVELDLWKWLYLDKTYGEKTQKNFVGYLSVRSCTERGKSFHK